MVAKPRALLSSNENLILGMIGGVRRPTARKLTVGPQDLTAVAGHSNHGRSLTECTAQTSETCVFMPVLTWKFCLQVGAAGARQLHQAPTKHPPSTHVAAFLIIPVHTPVW